MPATSQYDVVLDGAGYLIDPETYRSRLKAQLAPKTRTGDTEYGDLEGTSAWAQTDFRGGFGYENWDPKNPTRFADGTGIDTSYGDLRPGRTLTLVPSSPNLIAPLVIHRGLLYGIESGGTKIWSSANGTTWGVSADLTALGFPAVQSLWEYALELWAGSASSGELVRFAGGSWGVNEQVDAASAPWGITAGFQGNVQLPTTVSLFASGSSNFAQTWGSSTAGPGVSSNTATVPYQRVETIVANGTQAYFGAQSVIAGAVTGGFYFVHGLNWNNGWSGPTELGQRLHDNGVVGFQVFQRQLYAGSMVKGILWRVDGSRLTAVFQVPELARAGAPPAYTHPIRQMTTENERLYVPITDENGACLYQWDGTGWCRFTNAIAGVTATAVISFGGAILLATSAGVYRTPETSVASPATLITSWFDAGLGGIDKIPLKVTLTHTPLTAGQSITLEYALNYNETWTLLGTANTVGATETELTFPSAVPDASAIRFRYTLTGATAASNLKVRNVIYGYQLAPDVKREWLFTALCAGVPGRELVRLDETAEPLSGAALSDRLWASRAKKTLLPFTDIDGTSYTVNFESLEEDIDRAHPRSELATRAAVRLVEV